MILLNGMMLMSLYLIFFKIQDQAIAIVSELCEANKPKHINPEIQSVCLLLLQIMEMALYLELCVLQICGIRPVLGRVEDFSKEVKLLLKGKYSPYNILLTISRLNFWVYSCIVIVLFYWFLQLWRDTISSKHQ